MREIPEVYRKENGNIEPGVEKIEILVIVVENGIGGLVEEIQFLRGTGIVEIVVEGGIEMLGQVDLADIDPLPRMNLDVTSVVQMMDI